MTALLQLAAALIAFSLPLALYASAISRSPTLTVIAIAAAAFWLLSVLAASLAWAVVGSIGPSLIIAACLQEGARAAFVLLYRALERSIASARGSDRQGQSPHLPLDDASSSVAAGFGFGFFHALIMCGGAIAASGGEATRYEESCPNVPLVLVSAYFALGFFVLDLLFTVVAFHAERRKDRLAVAFVLCFHGAAAMATLFHCSVSVPLLTTVVASALFAGKTARAATA